MPLCLFKVLQIGISGFLGKLKRISFSGMSFLTSIKNLQYIVDYQKDNILNIECSLLPQYQQLYDQVIEVRKDMPEKLIRLSLPRKPDIPICNTLNRRKGTITMQNKLAQRYSGEVSLIKSDLSFEARSNVIGFISPEHVKLLDFIDSNTKIVFRKLT